jgi:hypothetical protein
MSDVAGASGSAATSTSGDIAGSAAVGAAKGAIGIAGLPGDLAELGAKGINAASGYLGPKLGMDIPQVTGRHEDPWFPTSPELQKKVEGYTGDFYKPQTTAGKYAETIGEFTPGMLMGPGGLARRAVTQVALPGAASEAAGQATEGTKAEPYARIAGALAGGMAPSAIGRLATPAGAANPSRQRLVDILSDEGVTSLTAGQRTGNEALRYAESVLGNAPMSGQQTSRIMRQGQEQFTDATLRRAGTAGEATPETLLANNQRLGNEFEQLSARNTLQMDPQFGRDIGQAVRSYDRVPPSQQRAIVEGYVNDIIQHAQQGGQMPGTFYQEMRSRLSRQANGLRQSDPTLAGTLGDLRDALDGAMRRSISPADRQAWDTARREYGAQKVIEKAASRAGEATAEGQIVPANLRNTVAAENRGAYARGQGDFSELARAGAGVMGQMPQSGTAPRSAMYNLANYLTVGSIPALAGRALMSAPAQAYLGNQVAAPMLRNLNPRQQALIGALMAGNSSAFPRRNSQKIPDRASVARNAESPAKNTGAMP